MSRLKVVQINTFPYKATGSIMMNLHNEMQNQGIDSYVVWGRGRNPENANELSIGDKLGIAYHGLYSRITDKTGFASKTATKKLLSKLDVINPDIVHLHNLHGYYINIEILFNWLRMKHKKILWTLHDCWSFTGHCAYFDACGCEKWKKGCEDCEQLKTYPQTIGCDNSAWNWGRKKELFSHLDITIITPCEWLKNIVKQSFLGDYPVEVINNGIDLNVFHSVKSNFKRMYGINKKHMILGVASEWTKRKGLADFIKLESRLDRDKYKIVLVGLTAKQKEHLPDNIIGITRTQNVSELVGIYSAADCFFNPTYEDNYPTTNIESIACGTPVITYNTGGSPESVNEYTGVVFDKGDIESVVDWINRHCYRNISIDKAQIQRFSKENMIKEYMRLYRQT